MMRTTTTIAVRTARLPFIYAVPLRFETVNLSLSPPFFHRRARFAIGFAALDGFTLVVRLLAFGQSERNLDVTVLEINPGRHDVHGTFDRPANQLADLLAVKQEFSLARGLMIGITAVAVRVDVDVVDPHFSVVDTRKAVAQFDVAFTDRLHFGSDQLHAGFERLEDVVVVKCLAIFRDAFLCLFSLSFYFLSGRLRPRGPPHALPRAASPARFRL